MEGFQNFQPCMGNRLGKIFKWQREWDIKGRQWLYNYHSNVLVLGISIIWKLSLRSCQPFSCRWNKVIPYKSWKNNTRDFSSGKYLSSLVMFSHRWKEGISHKSWKNNGRNVFTGKITKLIIITQQFSFLGPWNEGKLNHWYKRAQKSTELKFNSTNPITTKYIVGPFTKTSPVSFNKPHA